MTGHLVRVDENGTRTSYGINIKAHWFPGDLDECYLRLSPRPMRAFDVLLEMRPEGESTIQIAHPGDAKPSLLPFEKWTDGPLGAGFSYEDFLEATYFWPSQAAQGKTKFGARNCELIVEQTRRGGQERTTPK